MGGLSATDQLHLKEALQIAVVKCSERCLYNSAKWAAELLDALPEPPTAPIDPPSTYVHPALSPNTDPEEAALEARELNKYLLAKSLFDCKEYDRCSAIFIQDSYLSGLLSTKPEDVAPSPKGKGKATASEAPTQELLPVMSQKSLFLALYAKVISGEKKRDEDTEMVMGSQDLGSTVNKQLLVVGRFLELWFAERTGDDGEVAGSQGFLEYLYGMVLAKEKNEQAAMDYFVRSVHLFPMNWGCWLEMTNLISRVEHVSTGYCFGSHLQQHLLTNEQLNQIAGHLPQNIMSFIFHLHTSLELYQQGPNLAHQLEELLNVFPTSAFLLTCKALLAYHSKDLIGAEQDFAHLLSLHQQRLEALDHYSNILYVLELRPKLAFLAHLCNSVDRFRPETCVVVGNYYSLLSQHEKAVQYFRRALTLDRSCLSAWTLMGHEYVELKNTHAAIESYRRAVEVNRRDYRAWYGLGQTYEVLEMHAYALWYYKRAAGIRPWDGKMWMAVGSCLQKVGRNRDGIKALKRALLAESYYDSTSSSFGSVGTMDRMAHMDPEVLLQIANMYDGLDEEEEAKAYMELCIAQEDGGAGAEGGDDLGSSLAIHHDSSLAPGGSDDEGGDRAERNGGNEGTGVTVATSKARMWLAQYAMRTEDYATATRLANELCQDGVEVEEAKALIREARSRMESASLWEG